MHQVVQRLNAIRMIRGRGIILLLHVMWRGYADASSISRPPSMLACTLQLPPLASSLLFYLLRFEGKSARHTGLSKEPCGWSRHSDEGQVSAFPRPIYIILTASMQSVLRLSQPWFFLLSAAQLRSITKRGRCMHLGAEKTGVSRESDHRRVTPTTMPARK